MAGKQDHPRGSGKQFAKDEQGAERVPEEGTGEQFADAQSTDPHPPRPEPQGTGKQFAVTDHGEEHPPAKGSGKQFAADDLTAEDLPEKNPPAEDD